MSEKFTIVFRFDVDGERCEPPPHIAERIVQASVALHEMGFGLDVAYGFSKDETFKQIETEMAFSEGDE